MALSTAFEPDRETVEPHEENFAAEQLYNERFADRAALYDRPRATGEQGQGAQGGETGPLPDELPGAGSAEEDVQEAGGADRVSRLYQEMRAKARARQAVAAAKDKAKQAAAGAVKKMIIKAILPYLIPILIIIGVILVIAGVAIYLTTMIPGVGA